MHDWSLRSIKVDYASGNLEVFVKSHDRDYVLNVLDFKWLNLTLEDNWGLSSSILSTTDIARGKPQISFR